MNQELIPHDVELLVTGIDRAQKQASGWSREEYYETYEKRLNQTPADYWEELLTENPCIPLSGLDCHERDW